MALRYALLDSLIDQLDQTVLELQAARKVAAELRRATVTEERTESHAAADAGSSLRFSGMTVSEAAARLRLGDEQVRRLLRRGVLAGVPFGGRAGWRLPREAVERMAAGWDNERLAQEAAKRPPAGHLLPPGELLGQRRYGDEWIH
jgi:excisionase family DNA binding protein